MIRRRCQIRVVIWCQPEWWLATCLETHWQVLLFPIILFWYFILVILLLFPSISYLYLRHHQFFNEILTIISYYSSYFFIERTIILTISPVFSSFDIQFNYIYYLLWFTIISIILSSIIMILIFLLIIYNTTIYCLKLFFIFIVISSRIIVILLLTMPSLVAPLSWVPPMNGRRSEVVWSNSKKSPMRWSEDSAIDATRTRNLWSVWRCTKRGKTDSEKVTRRPPIDSSSIVC